jgi:hypothetical protein
MTTWCFQLSWFMAASSTQFQQETTLRISDLQYSVKPRQWAAIGWSVALIRMGYSCGPVVAPAVRAGGGFHRERGSGSGALGGWLSN